MDQPIAPQEDRYTPAPAPLHTSGLATASLVTGILGFTFIPVVGGIIAIITGYAARKETRATPPQASGDGLATAEIIMGWVQIGLAVIALCCFVAYMVFVLGLVGSTFQGGQ